MNQDASVPERGSGYGDASVAGAVLATFFFPLVSLIVALLLLGNQPDPGKRAGLRLWAWASFGWLVLQVIVVAAIAISIVGSSSATATVGFP